MDLIELFLAFFKHYGFSEFSKIRDKKFDEYVSLLNPNQTKVYQVGKYKKIEWNDLYTLYVAVFNQNGELVCIEREVWYEYRFMFFGKKVIFDCHRNIKCRECCERVSAVE